MQTLRDIGEHEAIRQLTACIKTASPDLRVGPGDDCAVCRLPDGKEWEEVFTTDPVIEGVHFFAGENPERIGHKAVGRILSDLAAMGAEPRWILVNLVAPASQSIDDLKRAYLAMKKLAHSFGAQIIGGDLAEGPRLAFHLFGTGILPAQTALLRATAQPGDSLFVTGKLGCSAQGKHLDFMPRVKEGIFLRKTGWVHALMDISDGLATDLPHLLSASNVGAVLHAEKIPCNGTLQEALFDGEDFELLFSVSAEHAQPLQALWSKQFSIPLTQIGILTPQPEQLHLLQPNGTRAPLQKKAFEHFKSF
jgi:thiamine-monophosphate kinase